MYQTPLLQIDTFKTTSVKQPLMVSAYNEVLCINTLFYSVKKKIRIEHRIHMDTN